MITCKYCGFNCSFPDEIEKCLAKGTPDDLTLKLKKGIDIGGKKNIFIKANINSLVGLPLAFVANMIFLPLFAEWFIDASIGDLLIGAGLVAIPFYMISVFRQTLIDIVYEKYDIRIDPKSLCQKIWNKIK